MDEKVILRFSEDEFRSMRHRANPSNYRIYFLYFKINGRILKANLSGCFEAAEINFTVTYRVWRPFELIVSYVYIVN